MKKFLSIILLTVIFTGVFFSCENKNGEKSEGSAVYDETQFFIKSIEGPLVIEYFICYRNPDGSETEIVKMGTDQTPFRINGERIYYTQFCNLISVDFSGKDKKYLNAAASEDEISFEQVISADGEWIYCSGSHWEEIYGDPVALDDPHRIQIYLKAKTDFSEYSIIKPSELPKLPATFDRLKLYNAIISEVKATNDMTGVKFARILVEPNGRYAEMLLTVWAYDSTYNNGSTDVDKWIEGNVLIKDDGINGLYVEFIKTSEIPLYSSGNPLTNKSMATLSEFTVDIANIYNSSFIENHITGEPKRIMMICKDDEFLEYKQYIAEDKSNADWFYMAATTPEKIEKPKEITLEMLDIANQDNFIVIPFYDKKEASGYCIAFENEDCDSANLMVVVVPRR